VMYFLHPSILIEAQMLPNVKCTGFHMFAQKWSKCLLLEISNQKVCDLGWLCILCFLTKLNNSNGDLCASKDGGTFALLAWRPFMPNYVSNTLGAKGGLSCEEFGCKVFDLGWWALCNAQIFPSQKVTFSKNIIIFQDACPLFDFLLMILNRYPWVSRQFKKKKTIHLGLDIL
jgi:hypothetical protein